MVKVALKTEEWALYTICFWITERACVIYKEKNVGVVLPNPFLTDSGEGISNMSQTILLRGKGQRRSRGFE